MRRCCNRRTAAAVVAGLAALCLGWSPAKADPLSYFQLSNTSGKTITSVLAQIDPAGAVAPPDPSISPLMILPGSTGFDAHALNVALGAGKTGAGDPLEAIKVSFGSGGFKPGALLNFGLTLAPTFEGGLPTPLLPANSGLTLVPYAYTPGGATAPPPSNTPEPLSAALWAGLAGVGWLSRRRARRASA